MLNATRRFLLSRTGFDVCLAAALVLLLVTLNGCSPTFNARPMLPDLPPSAARTPIPFPAPPAPVGRTTDGAPMYDLADAFGWAGAGAKAYADARAQGLACVDFYHSLQRQEVKP